MPEKSASIAQQRLLGMAWAARTGRLDTSKIDDKDWREKVERIAKSDKFSDDTLHKMASTKHKDPKTKRKIPYLIGKGTPEQPERKRKPYKKRQTAEAVEESFVMTFDEFMFEKKMFESFYDGYCDALSIMDSTETPDRDELYETYMSNMIPHVGTVHTSYSGSLPVKHWMNVENPYHPAKDEDNNKIDDITDQQFLKAKMMFKGYKFAPTFEEFQQMKENLALNPGMNLTGMGPVNLPGNPGTTTGFHSQEAGSGDLPHYPWKDEDEDEEEEKKRIKKELKNHDK